MPMPLRTLLALLCAALGVCAPGSGAWGQGALDGRDFGGVDIPAAPRDARVLLSGQRARAWRERFTNRVLLERDVVVQIGPHRFEAARAVVWLEPVIVGGREGDQVAAYFEDVRTSLATRRDMAGGADEPTGEGDTLLVTAVVVEPGLRLRTDLLRRGRPDAGARDADERDAARFVREGEARLARHLAQVAGVGAAGRSPLGAGDEDAGLPGDERDAPAAGVDGAAGADRPPRVPIVPEGMSRGEGTVFLSGPDIRLLARSDAEPAGLP